MGKANVRHPVVHGVRVRVPDDEVGYDIFRRAPSDESSVVRGIAERAGPYGNEQGQKYKKGKHGKGVKWNERQLALRVEQQSEGDRRTVGGFQAHHLFYLVPFQSRTTCMSRWRVTN